jgi:Glycosyltransferase like family
MIAFGCSVTEPEPYLRYVAPGFRLAAEPDSKLFPYAAVGTIGRSYNVLLDAAAAQADLEALVIAHPHTEIADPQFCAKVRQALADPDVAVVGCAGATGVRSLAWWEGSVSCGHVVHRYLEHGGGDLPAFAWTTTQPAPAEVETVDGFLLVLSPWAVRNIRFDEGLSLGHGFDLDFCLQVRAAGRKVMTADLDVIQHRSLEVITDLEMWTEAHIALAQKWGEQLSGHNGDQGWKAQARRAEAEREAARSMAYSRRLAFDARVEALEREFHKTTRTISWRVTAPLRQVNKWRRERRSKRDRELAA